MVAAAEEGVGPQLDIAKLIELWDIVQEGKLVATLIQESELVKVRIEPEKLVVVLKDLDGLSRFIPALVEIKDMMGLEPEEPAGGGSITGKLDQLKAMLEMLQGIADLLDEKGKTVIVKYNDHEVLALGKQAGGFGLGFTKYKNIEVKRKLAALRLAVAFKDLLS